MCVSEREREHQRRPTYYRWNRTNCKSDVTANAGEEGDKLTLPDINDIAFYLNLKSS